MTGHGVVAAAMGRSSLIWSATRWSIFCRIARPRHWLSGYAIIAVSRSSPETVPAPTQMAYVRAILPKVPRAQRVEWQERGSNAIQVTDRWHLLRNLGDAVRAVVDRQHAAIRWISAQIAEEAAMPAGTIAAVAPEQIHPIKPTAAEQRSQTAYARRQARYEEAARLRASGMSIKRITVALRVERKTIRR
jgi:DNA-binding NarL/FixJ family response regulator